MVDAFDVKEDIPNITKRCTSCNIEKPLSDYYRAGKYLMSRCKTCHSRDTLARLKAKRPQAQPRGFTSLPDEQKRRIIDDVNNGRDIMQIAIDNGIHIDRLRGWKRRGKLVMPAAQAAN